MVFLVVDVELFFVFYWDVVLGVGWVVVVVVVDLCDVVGEWLVEVEGGWEGLF